MQADTYNDSVFSVSEVNQHIKNILENMMGSIMIEGEISGLVKPASGHFYFSLKDEKSLIKCVFFKHYSMYCKFNPKNGDKVVCSGRISVFERDGQYQLQVMSMHLGGQGLLQARFEELKKKLQSEGLFDTRFKKPIPKMPGTIGVITSSTGAAFQDICNVLSRRFPVQVKLFHATVQGENAPKELIAGLHYFNITKSADVIIIGRGGGSQEDLFCFNDEGLARAVFASEIPVISAVGHEIDFTICDFVSDLRAPTPSAAAEIAVPDKTEFINKLQVYSKHLKNSCLFRLSRMRNILSESDRRMQRNHPERIIFSQQQYLDQMSSRLQLSIKRIGLKKDKLNNLYKKLEAQHPRNIIFNRVKVLNEYSLSLLKVKDLIRHRQVRLQKLQQRLESNLQEFSRVKVSRNRERLYKNGALLERSLPDYLNRMKSLLDNYQALIREYSPKRAMEKGYALIRKEKKLITSVKDLKINDKLSLDFKDGNAECLIEKISYE